MLDYHLAELYQVETKRINEQVKRNINRFPDHYMFQLTEGEWSNLHSQITTAEQIENLQSQIATAKRRTLPYVFTEQGVGMLSAVLNSEIAVSISIQIMDAFVEMRKVLSSHKELLQRMDRFEIKQADHDQKFEKVFQALESKTHLPRQGVFFNGQTFDAYSFTSELIRSAKKSIDLIDNYVDDTVLTLLDKRKNTVEACIYTKSISKQLQLDLQKHNSQYPEIVVKVFSQSHDRFMIIDKEKVYHIGASLKDLGKKWFAFAELQSDAVTIVQKIWNL